MRPEILELKNFGPFCGEHKANFAALGDFFLICGETGSGKTTLFDAISYAFYGEAPGGRKGLGKQLRSQHAKDSDESFVRLTFSIGAGRWRIRRVLPGEKISEKTKKVKATPEEVSLEREKDGAWVSETPGGKKETDSKILSLVKLSADEFSRIVLLPQGEFSRFLKQSSEERKEILSKLFPVSIYSGAAEKIKAKAAAANAALAAAASRRDALREAFNPENFEAERQSLEEKVATLKKESDALQQRIIEHTRLMEKAQRIEEKKARLKAAKDAWQREIAGQEEASLAWQARLDAGNRAAPVAGFIAARKSAQADLEAARLKLEDVAARLSGTLKEINLLEADREKAESAGGEIASLVKKKTLIEGAVEAATEYEKSAAEIKSLDSLMAKKKDELGAIESEVAQAEAAIKEKEGECGADTLMRLAQEKAALDRECEVTAEKALRTERRLKEIARLEELKAKCESIKEEIAKTEAAFKEAEEEAERAKAALQQEKEREAAAAIAASLEEGAPCPVCGSIHHPAPATTSGKSLEALEREAKAAESRKAQAASALQSANVAGGKAEGELAAFSAKMEGVNVAVFESNDEAQAAFVAAKSKAESARLALEKAMAARKEADALKERSDALRKRSEEGEAALQEAARRLAALSERNVAALARFRDVFDGMSPERAAAVKSLSECEAERAALERFLKNFRQRDDALRSQRAALEGSRQELESSVESLAEKAAGAEAKLKEECLAAGFAAFEDAEAAVLRQGERLELAGKIEGFKARKSELENQISVFRDDLDAEKADAPPDIEEKNLAAEHEALALSSKENMRLRDEAVSALSALEGNRKNWEELEAECAKKQEEAAVLSSLSADLQGKNSRGVKFEAWILSQYLEEIAEYANIRIARLSCDRYRLRSGEAARRGNAMTGLDLEIFDSHTGKTRPVATLSGGEMFMASISLALGLADSIQSKSGGIQLEAVFIDEGFGSLDDDCIELAMDILDEIRGQRMVGIISHVRELKERIPEKLEVKKKPSGGSFLRQSAAGI